MVSTAVDPSRSGSPGTAGTEARRLAYHAAIQYVLALLTGGLAAFALSGQLGAADGRIMLGAHVTAITGTLIMLGVAYTMPMLHYGPVGRSRVALGFLIATYSNWIISSGKAFLFVHGVGATGQLSNDVVFGLLNVFVVAPSLVAAVAWALGLREPSRG